MLRRYNWDTQGCCFGRAPIGVTRKNHPTTFLPSLIEINNWSVVVRLGSPFRRVVPPQLSPVIWPVSNVG